MKQTTWYSPQHMSLLFTRDRQIITQHAWFYANTTGITKLLNITLPYCVPSIYYVHAGAMEIWEDPKVPIWLSETILKTNRKCPLFIKRVISSLTHQVNTHILPLLKNKPLNTITDLKKFISTFNQCSAYYLYIWISMLDEKTPKPLKLVVDKWRNQDDLFGHGSTIITASLKKIFPDLAPYHHYIMASEINNPPVLNELKQRCNNFLTIPGQYACIETLKNFATHHPEYIFDHLRIKKTNTFKGQIAYPGKVRGTVKVVRSLIDISRVYKNNIIVSPMTLPEFIPAMKRAAAFVTDEGGITCHAAIVAREMKKPCIIGTKIGTKLIKDGQKIEVNANTGIIKLL